VLIEVNQNLTPRQLRWFAGLWFPAFCTVVVLALNRRGLGTAAVAVGITGAVLSIAGLIAPAIIRPVYRTLTWVTFPIGWVASHVLLRAMYYGVVTPVGVLLRRFTDPLDRSFDRAADSYWMPHEPSKAERYFRQF
jgi:hypothetical protein